MARFYVVVREKVVQDSVMIVDADSAQEAENKAVGYTSAYPRSCLTVPELCEVDTWLTTEGALAEHVQQCSETNKEDLK